MEWTVWKRRPELPMERLGKMEELALSLVHWTEEKECRVIELRVDSDGNVSVEHSTSENIEGAPEVEHITRVSLVGWEE